jgi:hypothetical protein
MHGCASRALLVRFLDVGHFALKTHAAEIGTAMRELLLR